MEPSAGARFCASRNGCLADGPGFAVELGMNSITRFLVLVSSFACIGACATTSAEAQSRAQAHQYKSDQAAARGFYGAAANEQRKAADAHQDAVDKAIKEGVAIPAQPQPGDGNPDGGAF
ncbi:MAG: hypothetical protein DI536_08325 [Archangium gephyra]|uniref:Uncharacterized protein n=1 Tax=Archangium gephyra TaxID=48 RepID=A0A2W5TSF3_9BACT|nr:MAG: hypothetical protein DI536_08325 [Archangium gephyra]